MRETTPHRVPRRQPAPVVLIAGCMSESSGIPTPGVYTMGSPVGMEWTTGSPRTLGHSVGGGEEAEHRVTARKGSGTHPLYHQVLETAKALKNGLLDTWTLQEVPLEEEMATHSSILVWGSLRTEEPGRLQSMGSERVGHD